MIRQVVRQAKMQVKCRLREDGPGQLANRATQPEQAPGTTGDRREPGGTRARLARTAQRDGHTGKRQLHDKRQDSPAMARELTRWGISKLSAGDPRLAMTDNGSAKAAGDRGDKGARWQARSARPRAAPKRVVLPSRTAAFSLFAGDRPQQTEPHPALRGPERLLEEAARQCVESWVTPGPAKR